MTALSTIPIKDVALGIYDGPHATPQESTDGAVFLGIKNISNDGRLNLSEIRHISENDMPRWTKRVKPSYGDIVFTYEATLHRYAIIPEGFHGCLGRRVALIRPDTTKVNTTFLLYYFLTNRWRSVVERFTITGATVDRIPLEKFPDFPVHLPPLHIQKKTASILSAYDDLIENNLRRIELLENAARLIYKEWFVKLNFPGREHTKIVDGVPEGWIPKFVPEIIDINPRTKVDKDNENWYVDMACLPTDSMVISNYRRRQGNSGSKFQNGDVLFARITPCLENGKTGFVNFMKNDETGFGSTEFIVLRGNMVPKEYVYCLARSYEFREKAIKSMIGSSGRQRVQVSCFDDFLVPLPPSSILHIFQEITTPCFDQIRNLMFQNQKLKAARDLLLPKLMSGEITV